MFLCCDIVVFDKEDLPVLVAEIIKVRLFDTSTGFFIIRKHANVRER